MITFADELIANKRCDITIKRSIHWVVGHSDKNVSLLLTSGKTIFRKLVTFWIGQRLMEVLEDGSHF